VLTGCCKPGSAYARGGEDAFSKATCFRDLATCTNNNWGWSNALQRSGEGTYDLYSGAGNKACQKGSYVGSVFVKCEDNVGAGYGTAKVTLGPVTDDANCGGNPAHHYYIGCLTNPECTPPAFGAPKKPPTALCTAETTNKERCGGTAPTTFMGAGGAAVVRTMPCPCSSVKWVVHEAR
jgi:hypothetical protein